MTVEERADTQAELELLREKYERLSYAPARPAGENWRASRREQRDTIGRHIARVERLLQEPS